VVLTLGKKRSEAKEGKDSLIVVSTVKVLAGEKKKGRGKKNENSSLTHSFIWHFQNSTQIGVMVGARRVRGKKKRRKKAGVDASLRSYHLAPLYIRKTGGKQRAARANVMWQLIILTAERGNSSFSRRDEGQKREKKKEVKSSPAHGLEEGVRKELNALKVHMSCEKRGQSIKRNPGRVNGRGRREGEKKKSRYRLGKKKNKGGKEKKRINLLRV